MNRVLVTVIMSNVEVGNLSLPSSESSITPYRFYRISSCRFRFGKKGPGKNRPQTIEKIKSYWYISKDKVQKCKECELRYFCIDCREKAQREINGNLYAANSYCNYDPQTGIWKEDQ